MLAKIPFLLKYLLPHRIWKFPSDEKAIYLSFDDGPIPEVTPWVLEQLKTYNAKASFFCIGDNIRKHPEVFREILAEGHSIGNHTYNHLNGWMTSTEKYVSNVLQAQEEIESFENSESSVKLFRPPYGRLTEKQARLLRKKGFSIVMWEVLSMDYDHRITPEKCRQNVLKNADPGSIIVFHDSLKAEKNLKAVLPKVLQYYLEKGYAFRAINGHLEGFPSGKSKSNGGSKRIPELNR